MCVLREKEMSGEAFFALTDINRRKEIGRAQLERKRERCTYQKFIIAMRYLVMKERRVCVYPCFNFYCCKVRVGILFWEVKLGRLADG